jgi:hypothetical protein
MHRSQAPHEAFMIRTMHAAAARNGAVSEPRNAGEHVLVVCDIALGDTLTRAPADFRGTDRIVEAWGGAERTIRRSPDGTVPVGRVLTTERAAGEPSEPDNLDAAA